MGTQYFFSVLINPQVYRLLIQILRYRFFDSKPLFCSSLSFDHVLFIININFCCSIFKKSIFIIFKNKLECILRYSKVNVEGRFHKRFSCFSPTKDCCLNLKKLFDFLVICISKLEKLVYEKLHLF